MLGVGRVAAVDEFILIRGFNIKSPSFQRRPARIAFLMAQIYFSSYAGNSSCIPVSELHRKGHRHNLKPISRIRLLAALRGGKNGGSVVALLADGGLGNSLHEWLYCLCVKEQRTEREGEEWPDTAHLDHQHGARHTELVSWAPWRVLARGRPFGPASSSSGCLRPFSFSLFHIKGHDCYGLSSFIKGSGASESLWCFLSRGGSTLLQRVQEGERM